MVNGKQVDDGYIKASDIIVRVLQNQNISPVKTFSIGFEDGAEKLDDAVQLVGEQGDDPGTGELVDPALAILRSQKTGLALHTGYSNVPVSDGNDKRKPHKNQEQTSLSDSETEKNIQEVQL